MEIMGGPSGIWFLYERFDSTFHNNRITNKSTTEKPICGILAINAGGSHLRSIYAKQLLNFSSQFQVSYLSLKYETLSGLFMISINVSLYKNLRKSYLWYMSYI